MSFRGHLVETASVKCLSGWSHGRVTRDGGKSGDGGP